MSLADLSLDEIISRQKKSKGGARRDGAGSTKRVTSGANRSVRQRGRGFTRKYESNDSSFTKTRDVPSGKWGHDGFDELYGGGSTRPAKSAPVVKAGGKSFGRSTLSRKVKLHITNLAPTVTTADIDELLESFPINSAVVHYDEGGQSVGTADVVTDRASAEEIKKNFSGVALDGQTMQMFIIDESQDSAQSKSIRERLSVSKRPLRVSRGITKRRSSGTFRPVRRSGPRSGARRVGVKPRRPEDKRKKMTDAELDKELDEYMKKGASAQGMES